MQKCLRTTVIRQGINPASNAFWLNIYIRLYGDNNAKTITEKVTLVYWSKEEMLVYVSEESHMPVSFHNIYFTAAGA